MARARLIRPGFFTNELLADLPAFARLLFAGLWTLADCEGRLEDRPRRIKVDTLPFDDVNIDQLLDCLRDAGFIDRYQVDGVRYIQVRSFVKHQQPHHRETPSTIPAPPALTDASPKDAPSTAEAPTELPATMVDGSPKQVAPRPLVLVPVHVLEQDPDRDPRRGASRDDAPAAPKATPRGRQVGRLFIHRWQVEHLVNALGEHAKAFGLDEWLQAASTAADGLVLSSAAQWDWLRARFDAEVQQRGLPLAAAPSKPERREPTTSWRPSAEHVCPHTPACGSAPEWRSNTSYACQLRTAIEQGRAERAAVATEEVLW